MINYFDCVFGTPEKKLAIIQEVEERAEKILCETIAPKCGLDDKTVETIINNHRLAQYWDVAYQKAIKELTPRENDKE